MTTIDEGNPIQQTKALIYAATGMATAALFTGGALQGSWRWAAAAIALGLFGAVAVAKDWGHPVGTVALTGLVIVAGVEVLEGAHPLWSLTGVTAAVVIWDLHAFRARLAGAGSIANPEALVRRHLTRLGTVVLAGFGLGAVALFLRVDYGIGTVVSLALLMAVSLGQIISQLRRRSD